MKRFYKLVTTAPQDGEYAVLLDGRPVKTPGRAVLRAGTKALAELVMREWAEQSDEIKPDTMPLTQMLSTKIDQVRAQRREMSEAVLKYLDTDLLCYRAQEPEAVASAQEQAWDPLLQKFETLMGCALETTNLIKALKQPQEAHKAVRDFVEALDDDRFNILQMLTPLSGSLVIAILFVKGQLGPDEVLAAARVEERYKDDIYDAEKYGRDPMFEKKDRAAMRDLEAAQKYLETL